MKLRELVQGIGTLAAELFPGKLMYVDEIPADAEGNFFLAITEQRGSDGISARRSRFVGFDLMYFSEAGDGFSFLEWADIMQDGMKLIRAGEFTLHTSSRRALNEDMVYHFLFDISAEYIEYTPQGEKMEHLEAGIENSK